MQISEVGGHVGQGIVGATLIPACPTCMQQPLEKDLLVYKSFPPPPHLLNYMMYIVFYGYFIIVSMITLLCLTFFPMSSREIKLFYHTSDSLLQGD